VTRRRRSPIALTVLTVLATSAALGAQGGAAAPAVPNIQIPSIPGSETARFKVIVEGTATAAKDEDWGASVPCVVDINVHIDETTTYRRGKGVVMEFVRLGKGSRAPILVQRKGRHGDSTLALSLTSTRTASGHASRTNPPEGGVCAPRTEDMSQGPECGVPQVDKVNVGMLYNRSLLKLELNGLGPLVEIDCPVSEVRGGIPSLAFGWPAVPPLPQMILPRGVLFGKKKVIVMHSDSGPRSKPVQTAVIGTLTGTVSDFGRNQATIRLIRVP
jgi:hypothetical protein